MYTPVFLTQGQFDEAIAQSKRELMQDFKAGTVPFNVPDLSGCHDYLDGNYYGGTGVMEGGDYDKLSKLADAARLVETGYLESFETDRCEDDDSVTQRYMADMGAVHDILNDYITSSEARDDFEALMRVQARAIAIIKRANPDQPEGWAKQGWDHTIGNIDVPATADVALEILRDIFHVQLSDEDEDLIALYVEVEEAPRKRVRRSPTCLECLKCDLDDDTVWPGDTLNIVWPAQCQNMTHHG